MISCYFEIPKSNDNWRNKRSFYRGKASLSFNALIEIIDNVLTIVLIVYVLFY